jgi:hypothetical protein
MQRPGKEPGVKLGGPGGSHRVERFEPLARPSLCRHRVPREELHFSRRRRPGVGEPEGEAKLLECVQRAADLSACLLESAGDGKEGPPADDPDGCRGHAIVVSDREELVASIQSLLDRLIEGERDVGKVLQDFQL